MPSGETFAGDTQKFLSQVGFHSVVEGWIVPRDVSFSCPAGFFPVVFRVESQFACISALV